MSTKRIREVLEEPVECLDCGVWFEAEQTIRYSMDWYGPQDEAFCPKCHSDNIKFHRPKEDR